MNALVDGGWSLLVDVVLKLTLLLTATWALLAAWRPRNANVAHRLWTIALLGMLAMPLLVQWAPSVQVPFRIFARSEAEAVAPVVAEFDPLPQTLDAAVRDRQPQIYEPMSDGADMQALPSEAPPVAKAAPMPAISWASIVALTAYAVGAAVFGLRLAIGLVQTRRVVSQARPVAWPSSKLREAGSTLLLVSDKLAVPVTMGIFRPAVLLPRDWRSWDEALLQSVLAHELEHVRRHDASVAALAALNGALYWFHPGAWWLRRRLAELAEQACDDAVIAATGNRASYARHLLEIAARAPLGRLAPQSLGVAMARTPQVEKRIDAIIDSKRPLSRRLSAVGALLVACVTLPMVILAAGLRATDAEAQPAPVFQLAAPAPAPPEPVPDEPITLSGRCTDGDKPLAGVRVRLLKVDASRQAIENTYEQTTGEDGRFAFTEMPPAPRDDTGVGWNYAIVATSAGRASAMSDYAPGYMAPNAFQFKMPAAASLRGRVIDQAGKPVTGVKVWTSSPMNDPIEGFMSATTDADGRYEISDVRPWDRQKVDMGGGNGPTVVVTGGYVQFRHPEYGGRRGLYTSIPATVDATLEPAAAIEGIVFDEVDGKLAEGAVVSMQSTDDPINRKNLGDSWQQTRTDARGRYKLTSLSAGKFNIWADAKDRTCIAVDSLETKAGQKTMAPIIRLSAGGWIEGRLLDAAGRPYKPGPRDQRPNVAIYGPSRPRSGAGVQSVKVDKIGNYRLRAAPGTNYPYVMSGGFDAPESVEVRAGETTKVDFRQGGGPRPILQVALPPIELPLPVEEEREAAARIRELGGWYKLDKDKHVTEVNMVYHDGKGADGQRRDNTQLTDAALAHVSAFPRLKTLLLKEGQVTDDGLNHIRGVESIKRVYLWDASIATDKGAEHLATLPNLEYIHLSNSAITDQAIESWKRLPLVGLSLQGSRFTNAALAAASEIATLRELYVGLGEVTINDEGLVPLERLTSLEKLDLQRAQITDAGLKHIAKLGRLRSVSLSGTLVTPEGVAELAKALPDLDEKYAGMGVDRASRNSLRDAFQAVVADKLPPRLVYLAWQLRNIDGEGPVIGPIWDLSGKGVDATTDAELRTMVTQPVFNQRPEDVGRNAPPLVMWFTDESAMAGRPIMPAGVTVNGKKDAQGSGSHARPGKYRVCAAAPSAMFTWGPKATVEIQFPIESPRVVKELRSVPGEPTKIDDDAEWIGAQEPDGRFASTLRIKRGADLPLVSYGVRMYAKGNQWPVSNNGDGYTTNVDDREVRVAMFHVKAEDIDLVRLSRQQSGTAKFDDVPVRMDLMPKYEPKTPEQFFGPPGIPIIPAR